MTHSDILRLRHLTSLIRRGVAPCILACLICLVSCTNTECYDNKNSLPYAGFYSSELKPQAISIDSVSIYGVGAPGNAMIADSVANLSKVYLPFRIDRPETTYVIDYLQQAISHHSYNDTIRFHYDIIPMFVSSACGAIYQYRITHIDHTTHFIDSVTCPLGIIDNVDSENLRIYFRVSNDAYGLPDTKKGGNQ